MTGWTSRAALALVVCAQLGRAEAQVAYSDSLVQAPQLKPPERGSLAGQYASLGFGPGDLERGSIALQAPLVAPTDRGAPGAEVFPTYSPEAGLSEWGLGWQRAALALQRWRAAGDVDYATDDLTGPWGRMVRGTDGAWYPLGLSAHVRAFSDAAGTYTAVTADGARWTFGLKVTAPAGGTGPSGTYAWYLTSVETPTGRRTELMYTVNGSGRPFLSRASYGGVGPAFQHQIDFTYEATPSVVTDYRAGFAQVLDRRVSGVSMKSLVGSTMVERWRYALSYRAEGLGPAYLLASAQRTFASGQVEPPTTFDYASATERLAGAAFRAITKADGLVTQYGSTLFQANRTAQLDTDLDGRVDLEYAADRTLLVQQDDTFLAQPLPEPAPAGALTVCRPVASLSNPPRTLAQMRAGDDAYSVVALVAGANSTVLNVCDRAGLLTYTQTLPYGWTLGPKVRLADLNRDFQPDLIRVVAGGYEVLPNISSLAGYAFGASITGSLTPVISPSAIWLHDMNGDGIPDLVARMPTALVVWMGKGSFRFERQGTTLQLYSKAGSLVAPSIFELTFVDANKDGLADLVATRGGVPYLFVNTGKRFQETPVAGFSFVDASTSRAVVADLAGSGDTELAIVKAGHAYSLALAGADTNLLRSADDGKGTVLRFSYGRAGAQPGTRSRPSVLTAIRVESSGNDAVSYAFAYGTDSSGRFLLGFDLVTRTAPLGVSWARFLNEDRFAGIILETGDRDAQVVGIEKFTLRTFADASYQGVPWKRPATEEHGWRSSDGTGTPVSQRMTYEAWSGELCPARTRSVSGTDTLITETSYATPAALTGALSCVVSGVVKTGRHADPSLDFREEARIGINDVGLPSSITSVAGGASLPIQTIGYDGAWRIQSLTSPGKGTTIVSWDGAGRLGGISQPDGSRLDATGRDPLTDGLTQLRTVQGGTVYDRGFGFDGLERLRSAWDSVGGGTAANPDLTYGYRWATASQPAAITSHTLVDAQTGSYRDGVELLSAAGESLATLSRIPEGWSFGGVAQRHRTTGEQLKLQRPPLAAGTDPASLDYTSLYLGAAKVGRIVAGAFEVPTLKSTVFHAGVEQELATTLALVNGQLVTTVRENGQYDTSTAADPAGRVVGRWDEAGTGWGYVYDAAGRLRDVALPDGTHHRATYDVHGRIARVARDGVATVEYDYDPGTGLLAQRRFLTPAGALRRTVALAYDSAGRVIEERHTDALSGASQSYRYYFDGATPDAPMRSDRPGLLTAITGDGYEKRFEYRADGKLLKRTITLAGWRRVETTFDYDRVGTMRGRTVVVTVPGGPTLATSARSDSYDGAGRVSRTDAQGAFLALQSYDGNGLLGSVSFANGDAIALTYEPLTLQLSGVEQSTSRLYAADSRRMNARGLVEAQQLKVGATALSRQYGYSAQRFLTSSTDAQKAWVYGFDPSGLSSFVSENGVGASIVRSGSTLTAGSLANVLDDLGRTVRRGDLSLGYGPNGQVAVATRGGRAWTYLYDEAGLRILKLANGVPVAAYLDEGYLDESQLIEPFKVKGRTVGLFRNGAFESVTTDQLGTVMAEPDGTPRLASPFGRRDVHPSLAPAIDYVEKGYDADLGLVRMGVRDYDAILGRFTTPDPLFLESLRRCIDSPIECNLYGYAVGNPLMFVDPSGRGGESPPGQYAGDDAGIDQILRDSGYQARNTRAGMESIKPAAEALAQLHPGIAASVAVTGEEATGGKASTWERCAAGIQAFGGILAKGVGWAGRGIGQWFGIGRAAEEAAVVGKEASVVAHGWIDPGKLGYMFGEAGGRAHNVARTAQNAAQLARVGVYDTVEGRALLQAHLESVVMDPSNVVRTYSNEFGVFQIRESLFAGPGGFLKLESSWQVLEGGVFRFTSAIPMGGP